MRHYTTIYGGFLTLLKKARPGTSQAIKRSSDLDDLTVNKNFKSYLNCCIIMEL